MAPKQAHSRQTIEIYRDLEAELADMDSGLNEHNELCFNITVCERRPVRVPPCIVCGPAIHIRHECLMFSESFFSRSLDILMELTAGLQWSIGSKTVQHQMSCRTDLWNGLTGCVSHGDQLDKL